MKNDILTSENHIREIVESGFAAALACKPEEPSGASDAPGFASEWGRIVTKKPKVRPIPFDDILDYRPQLTIGFGKGNLSYKEVCDKYSIKIGGTEFQKLSGYHYGNYNNAILGERPIRAGQMMTACYLAGLSLQDTYDAFLDCRDVDHLLSYGYEAAVLAYLIKDREDGKSHSYNEFIWYTIKAYELAGIDALPQIFRGNSRWKKMQQGIRDGSITLTSIVLGG